MKDFITNHKFLLAFFIFNLLLSVITYILTILIIYDTLELVLISLFPIILITLIFFIGTKTLTKHPKITKIITITLTTLIVLCQLLSFFFILSLKYTFGNTGENYNELKDYSMAINSIHAQTCIKHFPKKIPPNAKNIKMTKTENTWFGSEYIFLKFDTDKKYINDELKKYKFKYIENGEEIKHDSAKYVLFSAGIPDENKNDFTFFIIHDRESEIPQQNSFPYHYGIIINQNKTTVIYYYINLD